MLADEVDYVVGVDTHRDQHVLAIVAAPTGAMIVRVGANERRGYARSCALPSGTRRRAVWAVEGAGHYGAGLARFLGARGEAVTRSGAAPVSSGGCAAKTTRSTRSGRPARRSRGNAGAAASGRAARGSTPALLARRSAVDVRRVALVQLRSVIVTAPESCAPSCGGCPSGAAPSLQPLPPLELTHTRPAGTSSCSARSPNGSRQRPRSRRTRTRDPRPRPGARSRPPRRARRRPDRRRATDRHLVTPRPRLLRSRLRTPRRRRTATCLKRPHNAPPPQPRRRPPTQPRPPHRHPPPPPTRPRDQGLHRPPRRRRQNHPRSPASSSATSPATSTA